MEPTPPGPAAPDNLVATFATVSPVILSDTISGVTGLQDQGGRLHGSTAVAPKIWDKQQPSSRGGGRIHPMDGQLLSPMGSLSSNHGQSAAGVRPVGVGEI